MHIFVCLRMVLIYILSQLDLTLLPLLWLSDGNVLLTYAWEKTPAEKSKAEQSASLPALEVLPPDLSSSRNETMASFSFSPVVSPVLTLQVRQFRKTPRESLL